MKKFDIMDACRASAKDFCETLLFCLEEHKIGKWLKEASYTTDENCIGACFGPINEHHQIRAMDFEYNGNIKDLDIDRLAKSIAENVIDDRFSVRVSIYDEEDEGHKNMFCVEIWLNK